jgi:PAS domain S-box-containing protein
MLANRLPYKFFMMLLIFAVVLVVPFFLITTYNTDMMVGEMEDMDLLSLEQRSVYLEYSEKMSDDLVAFSFYIFVLAFIISLFFSQRLLIPIKELYEGTRALRRGLLDVRLDITTSDELGEVTRAFNEMAEDLKKKTVELRRRDMCLNAMLDPMWVVDGDNIISDVNPAFTTLFGHDRSEVIGASVFDFLGDDSERAMRWKLYGRESGTVSGYEASIISKSEGLIPVLMRDAPIIEDGVVVGKIGIVKDFRDETALRETLRQEMEYTETVMDNMADGLLVIDREFTILKANLAARVSAGRDISGKFCHEVFHGSKEKCFLHGEECPVKTVFDTGRSYKTVHEHVDAGGGKVFNEIVAFPIKDRDGEVKHVIEMMKDVTESRKFEDELELRNRELTALNSISRMLSQSLRAEDIFNKVLDRIISLMGMDGGGIFFLDEHGRDLQCRFHRGLSEGFIKSIGRIKVGDDIPGYVALTGQTVETSDISRDKRCENSVLKHSGLKGFACLPIRGKERLIGVLFILSIKEHVFTADEKSTLNSIGEMSGMAFENITLYEKMRELYEQQRLRRAEEQKNLLSLSTILSSSLDMKGVIESCIALIKDACRADFAWLLESNDSGDLLLRTGAAGELTEGNVVYSRGTSSIELYAIQQREPVQVKEIVSETRFYMQAFLKGYNTVYCIPMFIGDKTLGVFSIYYSTVKNLPEEGVHFLQTVGSVLAVALQRASLYENVIMHRGLADTILESIADGVVSVDTDGRVVSMNKAAGSIVGLSGERARGSRISDMFGHAEENTGLDMKLEECLNEAMQGRIAAVDANVVTAEGRRVPLTLKSAPVRDNRGDTAGVVFILRDLSREKEIDSMKADFLMSVSHEFRTPLTAIVGMSEMVLDGDISGGRMRQYLGNILSEGIRLSDMVSDVLDVAMIERGKEVYRESEIDFNRIILNVRESFESVISKKEIDYTSTVDGSIEGFKGDELKIKQLLRNLLDNAMTYSDVGSSVELDVSKADGIIRITVNDNGWGIAEEDLSHAGERFFRGKLASRTKGTGLGLALCKNIARMHGGDLSIKSRPGEGTTVTVDLQAGNRSTEEE